MNEFLWSRIVLAALALCGLGLSAGRTPATELKGTVTATWTIYDDSKLIGDVTCMVEGGPCIVIGASNVKLNLNGFKITGTNTGCTPDTLFDDGIDVISVKDVAILGPGAIQSFGGFGIFLSRNCPLGCGSLNDLESQFGGFRLEVFDL